MRRIAWWIFNNIYVGKLAPWLFGFAIGRMPHKVERPKEPDIVYRSDQILEEGGSIPMKLENDSPKYGGNYSKFSDN